MAVTETDSWRAYEQCMRRIHEFLRECRVKGSEVWLGEVCLGSAEHPWLRVPVREDSARLLQHSIDHVGHLISAVKDSLRESIETSKRVIKELSDSIVDNAELAAIIDRIEFTERLLTQLTDSAASHSVNYHPAVLIRWRGILEQNLGPGDPAIRVKVEIVYVL